MSQCNTMPKRNNGQSRDRIPVAASSTVWTNSTSPSDSSSPIDVIGEPFEWFLPAPEVLFLAIDKASIFNRSSSRLFSAKCGFTSHRRLRASSVSNSGGQACTLSAHQTEEWPMYRTKMVLAYFIGSLINVSTKCRRYIPQSYEFGCSGTCVPGFIAGTGNKRRNRTSAVFPSTLPGTSTPFLYFASISK